ncbi:MAG: alpha-ribazole phosphatase [Chloroflexi bacterium]|jgi:alpha-ribazole phosphatase|nr:alpha-ribazole phosphatase [Chloroflexota bacterium]
MIRLFLVRHGITEWNHNGVYQGQLDVPLSPKGKLQITALRERLREEQFTVCYTSALSRAKESARIILEQHFCPTHETPDLNEMSYGRWEGLNRTQIMEQFPDSWAHFIADPTRNAAPGGETRRDLQRRVERVLDDINREYQEQDATILLVAHGGSLRAIVASFLNLGPSDVWKLRLDNASLTVIEVYEDGGVLSLFNDTAHLSLRKLPPDRQPPH